MFQRLWVRAKGSALARCERGVTALEYAVMAALFALAIVSGLSATGVSVKGYYNAITTKAVATLGTPTVGK